MNQSAPLALGIGIAFRISPPNLALLGLCLHVLAPLARCLRRMGSPVILVILV
jgi:hypothetical protein